VSDKSADKSARIVVRVRLVENAEQESRRTRRHPVDDPRAEVGEDVRVGVRVRVGPMEFQLYGDQLRAQCSVKLEFHGTNTDTDTDTDFRDAPIV